MVEQMLKEGLRRPKAPAGFKAGVMARIAARRRATRYWFAVAACVLLSLGIWGGQWQRQREAERTARVVSSALDLAREKIAQANERAAARVEKSLRYVTLVRDLTAKTDSAKVSEEGVNQ